MGEPGGVPQRLGRSLAGGGDFNSPLSLNEKKGGQGGWTRSMSDPGIFL